MSEHTTPNNAAREDTTAHKVGYRIKDLKTALKELEPMVKSADMKGRPFLIDGNNLPKKTDRIAIDDGNIFDMRPREAWVNWLMCAVLNEIHGEVFTFQEIKGGDGIIVNKQTQKGFLFEHVIAMNTPNAKTVLTTDELIIDAINKKVKKDKEHPGYAKNKNLAVYLFSKGSGEWHPSKVSQEIRGKHPFGSIYSFSLVSATSDGAQNYSITCLGSNQPVSYLVEIFCDFTDWKVRLIQ